MNDLEAKSKSETYACEMRELLREKALPQEQ